MEYFALYLSLRCHAYYILHFSLLQICYAYQSWRFFLCNLPYLIVQKKRWWLPIKGRKLSSLIYGMDPTSFSAIWLVFLYCTSFFILFFYDVVSSLPCKMVRFLVAFNNPSRRCKDEWLNLTTLNNVICSRAILRNFLVKS